MCVSPKRQRQCHHCQPKFSSFLLFVPFQEEAINTIIAMLLKSPRQSTISYLEPKIS
jgi:hypothetical protein